MNRKSQIALEYAYRHIQKSPRTSFFWVHAANHARFEQSYRNIAKAANLSGLEDPKVDILTAVHDWLNSESSGYWLMVIDNADDASMFFRDVETSSDRVEAASNAGKTLFECIPRTSKGSIIYTTRSRAAAVNLTGVGSIMPIESMSPAEAEILLRNKFGSEGLDKKESNDLLIELAYLPLAISQAAAFMKCTEQSISEYLKAFRENDREKEDLLSHEFIDRARDLRSSNAVLKTWRMSFNNIQKDDPRAADLLSVMSFMDRQSIPRYLLLGESESIGKFGRAMGTLTAFSLVTANSSNTMFNFHRLVHLCTRDWLHLHKEQDKWSKRALELVSTHFPDGTHENKDICAELLPHAEAVLHYDNDKHANDSARAKLLHNTGVYHLTRGLYPEAYRNVSEGLAIRKEVLGLHDRDTLTSSGKLASLLRHQGKYKEAEDMTREVLKEREKALGKDDVDTLTSVSDLAEVLWYENKYEEAKEANQRALEARERLLPKEHLDTLTSITIEGYLLRQRGMYDEAEAMHRRALNGRGLALGPEHPDTLSSMNNLAYVMRCQERYAAAQEMYQRVLDVRQRVLGPDHPNTLTSATNVAYMLKFQLNFQEAERMYRQILETRRRVLGDDHPKTLKGMKNLYWVLRYQGKEEAHTMNPEAWEAIE
jgi:tetratricopeptide (TPR) repeat protein